MRDLLNNSKIQQKNERESEILEIKIQIQRKKAVILKFAYVRARYFLSYLLVTRAREMAIKIFNNTKNKTIQ